MTNPTTNLKTDWLTVVAIGFIVTSVSVAFHEGLHAWSCAAYGQLLEFGALYVDCNQIHMTSGQIRFEAGISAIGNIIVGAILWFVLRQPRAWSANIKLLLWYFMFANFLSGTGYWMLSGIAGIGDYAVVIAGLEPAWLWRVGMAIIGTGSYMFVVFLSLQVWGSMIGGDVEEEQINRSVKIGLVLYGASLLTTIVSGLFNPYGFGSFPVVIGIIATAGSAFPLVWMMQWFRAKMFVKKTGPALIVQRDWMLIGVGVVCFVLYTAVLGSTLYF
ncbi:MAG: hypothetical protein AAF614_21795 [Chloroflexota bacterium]